MVTGTPRPLPRQSPDDRPICTPKAADGSPLSFDEIIERELRKEMLSRNAAQSAGAKRPTTKTPRETSGGPLLLPAKAESAPDSGDRNLVKSLSAPKWTLPPDNCGTVVAEQEENLPDILAAPADQTLDTSFSRVDSAKNPGVAGSSIAAPAATTNCEANASQLNFTLCGANDSFDSLLATKLASRRLFEDQLHEEKAELLEFHQVESRLREMTDMAGSGVEPEWRTSPAVVGASAENTSRPECNPCPGASRELIAVSTSSSSQAGVREYSPHSHGDSIIQASGSPVSEPENENESEQGSTRNTRASSFSDDGNWAKADDQWSLPNGGAQRDAEDDEESTETSPSRPASRGRSSSAEEDGDGFVELDVDNSADRAVIEYQMRRLRMSADEVSTEADLWEIASPVRNESPYPREPSRLPRALTQGYRVPEGSRRASNQGSDVLDESALSPRRFLRNFAGQPDDGGVSTSTPCAGEKAERESEQSRNVRAVPPPPTSKLLAGLFPGLRPRESGWKTSRVNDRDTKGEKDEEKKSEEILLAKLKDFEHKFSKLKLANERLQQEQEYVAAESKKLETDRRTFQRHVDEEEEALEKYKSEESAKLRKERSLWEKHRKATEILPSKSERAEMESLKQRMAEMINRWKVRERRSTAEKARLKLRIDQLVSDNTELQEQIRLLEQERLSSWNRTEDNTSKIATHDLGAARRRSWFPSSKSFGEITMDTTASAAGVSRLARAQPRSKSSNGFHKASSHGSTSPPAASASASMNAGTVPKHLKREKTPVPRTGMRPSAKLSPSTARSDRGSSWDKSYSSAVVNTTSSRSSSSSSRTRSRGAVPAGAREEEDDRLPDGHVATEKDWCGEMFAWVEQVAKLDYSVVSRSSQRAVADESSERVYPGGTRVIVFRNGTAKLIMPNGAATVWFSNGDVKQTIGDQHVVYFYYSTSITHTNFPDGTEVFEFPNGQTERRRSDGSRQIVYADNTVKHVFADGSEESVFPNGTVQRIEAGGKTLVLQFADGLTMLVLPAASQEVYAETYIQRLDPGGRCKTIYNDGTQEVRFPDGRIKVKDSKGQVIEGSVDHRQSGVIARPLDVGS